MSPNGWLLDHNMTGADLAARLNFSRTLVSRNLSGARYPSFQFMWAMFRLSNGAVSLPDWIALFETKAKAKSGAAPPPSRSPNPKLVRGKRR